ncbi:MAG: hypothetical protein CM15mP47_1140 [Methanobacteriota archaeon]|nr:MAG: hypothetical protein CM15mP47_1140 [Euryarchaeota archaeon]
MPQNWTAQIFFSENKHKLLQQLDLSQGGEFIQFLFEFEAPTVFTKQMKDELRKQIVCNRQVLQKIQQLESDLTTGNLDGM